MFSLPNGIYIFFGSILGAVLGSLISGGLLIMNNSRNNKYQMEREKQQRISQEESDRHKWYREKIYDSYRNSIQILTTIIKEKYKAEIKSEYDSLYESNHDLDLVLTLKNLYFEFTSEFSIIFVGHPYKDTKEFNEIIDEILNDSVDKDPFLARVVITRMMENDPRIKDINKGDLNTDNTQKPFNVI
ncbi:hypothetical protein [Microcoleus sp. D2_18a_B4]|uniref:hypothetical protein n=1 Tax=Microcoleus sp. D2_18a_B4 TaxID=3055329 RepID=UPI002FD74E2A